MATKKNKKQSSSYLSFWALIIFVVIAVLGVFSLKSSSSQTRNKDKTPNTPSVTQAPLSGNLINLPNPKLSSNTSIETALYRRRSRRGFTPQPLSLKDLSQMLWAAQGVTTDWGGRTSPSAKSAYPLSLYILANDVTELKNGVYKYLPGDKPNSHKLQIIKLGNFQQPLAEASGQSSVKTAKAVIVLTGDFSKMASAFGGKRLDNNVYLEAGHSAENMYLQAESLRLGMVVTGGFNREKMAKVIGSSETETLIYTIPLGHPKP